MKKQFNYLMMVLAMVILAGTSAFAQDGLTVADAYWHVPGSEHSISVGTITGSSYAWAVESIDCAGAAAANTLPTLAPSDETLVFTYSDNAAGLYRFTVTQTLNGCNTTREFFTAIMTVNLAVVASDGVDDSAPSDNPSCSDFYTRNSDSYLVDNSITDLEANIDAAWYNDRFVYVTLSTSTAVACPGMAAISGPEDFSWEFTYAMSSPSTNTNFEDNLLGIEPATTIVGTGGVTINTGAGVMTNTIAVDQGVTAFTLPIRTNVRFGDDTSTAYAVQDFDFTVSGLGLDITGGTSYTSGSEANGADGDNAAVAQTINASPATTVISLDY